MSATTTNARPITLPSLDMNAILTIVFAGGLATVAFDAFGQGLSPLLGFAKLAPVGLAQSTLDNTIGLNSTPAAEILHYLVGLVAYPAGWHFVFRPLTERLAPAAWPVVAVLYGVVLWVFALYVMAHLINGFPAMLGFSGITWVALAGHVLFTVVAAAAMRVRLDPR